MRLSLFPEDHVPSLIPAELPDGGLSAASSPLRSPGRGRGNVFLVELWNIGQAISNYMYSALTTGFHTEGGAWDPTQDFETL